ncbi:N-acetylneuraminate lyase B-like isoform X2 [Drosophila hydei]|uniref:N-acetylneuraminate lyase n=1 Tax=Drosophila hydei TaxID=7224 RepID=A0A6J1M548_DROHY|nr:N-acetylneuraminate lyase B-like isoform X2 [Drosophila hydei]
MAWFRRDEAKRDSGPQSSESRINEPKMPAAAVREADREDSIRQTDTELTSPTSLPKETGVFDSRFHGLLAPVFSCFKDDERRSLDVRPINRYAEWLRTQMISGVLINGVVGEGPMMRVRERKANCEYWQRAAVRHNLMIMVQVGGAPLADVVSLAAHAEAVRVSGVVTLPELFYRPRNVDQLVKYCQHVAKRCNTRPFFYYHMPSMTGVEHMVEFCSKAEKCISNFMGLYYASADLEMGQRCLRFGRLVMLASTALLASGLMSGFNCSSLVVVNIRPDLVHKICEAFDDNNLQLAREYQRELNQLIEIHTHDSQLEYWVVSMKNWFNKEFGSRQVGNFSAGPARIVY